MSQQGLLTMNPIAPTTAMLVSSNVPETDYPAWSAVTTYAVGAMVMLADTHSVYENSLANNLNKNPATNPDVWTRVRATNRWLCLDRNNSARTAQASSITYVFAPGMAVALAAMVGLVNCHSVRVRQIDFVYGTVFDRTEYPGPQPLLPDPWEWAFGEWTAGKTLAMFDGMPSFPGAQLHVELVGGPQLAIGHLMFGQYRVWGQGVSWGARMRREMYSKTEANQYGDLELLKRASAKNPSFEVVLRRHELDPLMDYLDTIEAEVCLFVISDLFESMTVIGVVQAADWTPKSLAEIYVDVELLGVV